MFYMLKTFISHKMRLGLFILIFIAFVVFGANSAYRFYSSIFKLNAEQVSGSLAGVNHQCSKITDCVLLPGDILIRRYLTKRTWLPDKIFNPYFTHSAFYVGNDQMVEAGGVENDPKDDIQISSFSRSDWLNNGIEDWVILRPNYHTVAKLDTIIRNLKYIAEDPSYEFGLQKFGYKRATCADLIFKQLVDESVLEIPNAPKIITPDYLFWAGMNNPNNFKIVGYRVTEVSEKI